jgi:hypothetical protein
MGNQQSGATQLCSRGQLYAARGEMSSSKMDPENRVGYNMMTKPKFQVQLQKAPQQMISQQQNQEEIVEIPLAGPGKWKIPKSFFEIQEDEEAVEEQVRKPSFNVYVSCLEKEEEPFGVMSKQKVNQDLEAEMLDYHKDDLSFAEGLYGNVILNQNQLVLYTDIKGEKHCEEYDRDKIGKIFPMGIAFGGLTKSIWFKDAIARDEAFDMMTSIPPSYKAVMANPTKNAIPQTKNAIGENDVLENDEDDNMKVFEGINGTNVIVHSENIVLYTDLKKSKHCIAYNKHNIRKCFPNGICDGGLPRAIWFDEEMERDLCFMLMRWNMEEECNTEPEESLAQEFSGLYGPVVLHIDSQIEFSALSGERVKCFYDPSKIKETFPKGISYGRLSKSIWFRDVEEREKCFEAMRKM